MSQCKCGRSVYSAHTTSSQYDLCDMCSRRSEVAHAISQARADALRWVLEQIKDEQYGNEIGIGPDFYTRMYAGIINKYNTRLRAIIEKELSK